jgi:hypothetical protein
MKRLILLAIFAACGSSNPVNVAGDYVVAGTYEANGCNINGWTQGNTFTGVQVTITQSGSQATAIVMGGAGFLIGALIGTNAFSGSVDGDVVHLAAIGTRPQTSGNCAYTYNAIIDATLTGNALEGTLTYTALTNNNPDCATIQGCQSIQNFSGSRPPM